MLEQLEKCHDYEIKNKRLDVNDLEWMSQFNEGIFSIKSNDGELLQINGEDYRFVNLDEKNSDSLRIIFSSDYDHFEEFHSPSSVYVGVMKQEKKLPKSMVKIYFPVFNNTEYLLQCIVMKVLMLKM